MKLKKTEHLKNGLTLNLFDASRKIAGDRWFVCILAKIEIPVNQNIVVDKGLEIPVENARALIGDKVVFEKKIERNFISEEKRDDVISAITQTFMVDIVPYLAKEKFAVKYLGKIYTEARERQSWYK